MIRFLADENFNGRVFRALLKNHPEIDIIRVQDIEIYEADDPIVLEWATINDRIVLSHDINTMTKYGNARIQAGLPLSGVILMAYDTPVGKLIESIVMIHGATEASEWKNLVSYLNL